MRKSRIIDLMQIERECVRRAKTCDRKCDRCELVQDDAELIKAYDIVINILRFFFDMDENVLGKS